MSINSLDKSSNQKINNQQVEQQNVNTKVNTSSNVISKKDPVSLTQSFQESSKLQAEVYKAPVDKDKVAKIRNAITKGEYKIDSEKLASKIAKKESEL
jgi:negative regulator of flagellin synthesis FlgM